MNNNTQKLAERIAILLQENERGNAGDDLSFVRASIEKINVRLDKIEAQITNQNLSPHSASQIPQSFHPSREKFANLEELADQIINGQNEKACPYEPSGKPCDHCAMCNSRGF